MYMEIPKGYTVSEGDPKEYVLEILSNTYGARQVPKQWYDYLCDKLKTAGWEMSKFDTNVFYHSALNLIFIFYVYDTIVLGPSQEKIDLAVQE